MREAGMSRSTTARAVTSPFLRARRPFARNIYGVQALQSVRYYVNAASKISRIRRTRIRHISGKWISFTLTTVCFHIGV